jgi:hypothetical protein
VSRKPAKTEPSASTTIGPTITGGDSWGWASSAQRRSPKKVITIIRVM